LLKNNIVF